MKYYTDNHTPRLLSPKKVGTKTHVQSISKVNKEDKELGRKTFSIKYATVCNNCAGDMVVGESAYFYYEKKFITHLECPKTIMYYDPQNHVVDFNEDDD